MHKIVTLRFEDEYTTLNKFHVLPYSLDKIDYGSITYIDIENRMCSLYFLHKHIKHLWLEHIIMT